MASFSEETDVIAPRASLAERARAEICRRVGADGHLVAQVGRVRCGLAHGHGRRAMPWPIPCRSSLSARSTIGIGTCDWRAGTRFVAVDRGDDQPTDGHRRQGPTRLGGRTIRLLAPRRADSDAFGSTFFLVGSRWGTAMALVALFLAGCGEADDGDKEGQLLEDAIESAEDGRFDDAVTSLTELIDLEPDDTDILAQAYVNRSFALSELGRFDEAVADSTAAIDLEPDDTDILAQAYLNRSVALSDLGRFDEALADSTAAIELEPDDTNILAGAYVNRSVALANLGRFDEALADSTAAIELEADDTDILAQAYLNRSVDLGDLGRFDEAVADDTAAIELEPSVEILAQAHYFRAIDFDALGRFDEAVDDLRRVVELLPPSHEVRRTVEQLLRELGADE